MSNHNKHLTIHQREEIQSMLDRSLPFKKIAIQLEKDPSTISKEVRRNRSLVTTQSRGRTRNTCIHSPICNKQFICGSETCHRKSCRNCGKCNSLLFCKDYIEHVCHLLSKAPYVCNGCKDKITCRLYKQFYRSSDAQSRYETGYSESRQGFNLTSEEVDYIESIIAPLIHQGQSIHHICAANNDKLTVSERTIYELVDKNVLNIRNIDLPRKVRYRPRKKSVERRVDSKCRTNRTWQDFQAYLENNPDTAVVEMDSVEGKKGGKLFLTMYFPTVSYILIFIRDANNSQSVIDWIEHLYETLGHDLFTKLFPVIVTDNGTEFSNPEAIEYSKEGIKRTTLFYCDPSRPDQKGALERDHEFIRMVLPKGTSFDYLNQDDAYKLMNHINSYARRKLGDKSPHLSFSLLYGDEMLQKLGAIAIDANDIILKPSLLTRQTK